MDSVGVVGPDGEGSEVVKRVGSEVVGRVGAQTEPGIKSGSETECGESLAEEVVGDVCSRSPDMVSDMRWWLRGVRASPSVWVKGIDVSEINQSNLIRGQKINSGKEAVRATRKGWLDEG